MVLNNNHSLTHSVFSEIISIGGKNGQIGGEKYYIGEGSGGCLRPPAGPEKEI